MEVVQSISALMTPLRRGAEEGMIKEAPYKSWSVGKTWPMLTRGGGQECCLRIPLHPSAASWPPPHSHTASHIFAASVRLHQRRSCASQTSTHTACLAYTPTCF